MKKAIILILFLCLLFVSCDSSNSDVHKDIEPAQLEVVQTSPITVNQPVDKPDYSIFNFARINQGTGHSWTVNIVSIKDYGTMLQIETDTDHIILVDKSNVILLNK